LLIETLTQSKTSLVECDWYGTPHSPFFADAQDAKRFQHSTISSRQTYGELVALDRSISIAGCGRGLREAGIAEETRLRFGTPATNRWFASESRPDTTAVMRGFQGFVYEGARFCEVPVDHRNGRRKSNRPRVKPIPNCARLDMFATIAECSSVFAPMKANRCNRRNGISFATVVFKTKSLAGINRSFQFASVTPRSLTTHEASCTPAKKKKQIRVLNDLNATQRKENNQFDPPNNGGRRPMRNENGIDSKYL